MIYSQSSPFFNPYCMVSRLYQSSCSSAEISILYPTTHLLLIQRLFWDLACNIAIAYNMRNLHPRSDQIRIQEWYFSHLKEIVMRIKFRSDSQISSYICYVDICQIIKTRSCIFTGHSPFGPVYQVQVTMFMHKTSFGPCLTKGNHQRSKRGLFTHHRKMDAVSFYSLIRCNP